MTPPDPPRPASPLAPWNGARPPAPDWFSSALARAPQRRHVQVEGAAIELLVWPGPAGDATDAAPGLLFIHGGWAHADWWSFIAPFFADERPCAAISLSGMGRSARRPRYSFDLYMAEALAAIGEARLGERAVVVAHSFGGAVASHMAAQVGERLGGVVMVDSGVRPPELRRERPQAHATRVRATFEAQLARFRLLPPQPCDNAFLVDHVARGSIRATAPPEPGGWTWCFDPLLWDRFDPSERTLSQEDELGAARCPLAFIVGERSELMVPATVAYTRAHAPPGTPVVMAPDAGHHVMLDQPLVLVAALRALLASPLFGPRR